MERHHEYVLEVEDGSTLSPGAFLFGFPKRRNYLPESPGSAFLPGILCDPGQKQADRC
jgi:hypothetical protein